MRKQGLLLLLLTFLSMGTFEAQIKGMDVPYAEFSYNNNSCSGYQSVTGSLIYIPADAFVTEDGSNCKGKITIKYRELHNRADMLVSGINMFLFKEGKRKMLESAGMFEIKAECNGKPMKLAAGKSIQVRLKCFRDLKNLKAYIYDQKNKYWLDAGIPVFDFSFKKSDNNQENVKLWGSGSVGNASVEVADVNNNEGNVNWDSIRVVSVNNIIGNLPEGFIKGMNIKETGIFNYDAVIKDDNAVPIFAHFKLSTGENITEKVYVAYPKKNMLIYYFPDDMKERFVLLPEKGTRIFCTFEDGSVATMKEGELDKINLANLKGKEHTFTLEKQPAKPKDKLALAEAVKIK